MYSKQDLSKTKIDGKQYITFHPNTIVYAVEAGTEAAKRITKSQIGIVWHTTYKGKDFASMKASYGVKKIPSSPAVWSQDAELSGAGEATMNEKETKEVTSYLSTAGFLFLLWLLIQVSFSIFACSAVKSLSVSNTELGVPPCP